MSHGSQPPPSAPPPPPVPPYSPSGYGDGEPPAVVRTNGVAVAALVFGLMSLLLPGMLSIPAVILGAMGRRAIIRSAGRERGMAMAISGIVLGIVTLLLLTVLVVVGAFNAGNVDNRAVPGMDTVTADVSGTSC